MITEERLNLHRKWVNNDRGGRRLVLIGEDLMGANLSGLCLTLADFTRADLRGADLSNAAFNSTDLSMADLMGANLSNANFRGAKMAGALLLQALCRETDFSKAGLSWANLNGADCRGASFRGAHCSRASFMEALLEGADFTEAGLWGTTGNGKEIMSTSINPWRVSWLKDGTLQIGCERHHIKEWEAFSDPAIKSMDYRALRWWKDNREGILRMVRESMDS